MSSLRQAVLDAGMVPLVIAPAGGTIGPEDDPVTVQRTFTTARSIEFDALLLAGAQAPERTAGDAAAAPYGLPDLPAHHRAWSGPLQPSDVGPCGPGSRIVPGPRASGAPRRT
ncbi:hypothetical protein [Streptomyces cyaneofuscatus]|uniref:hypothetical protein n=1 Tax=Streptomyces cyaneofuscatus TaxID=66883 RepID=UPI00366A24B7